MSRRQTHSAEPTPLHRVLGTPNGECNNFADAKRAPRRNNILRGVILLVLALFGKEPKKKGRDKNASK